MRRPTRALAFLLATAVGLAPLGAQAAPRAERVSVEIDTSDVGDEGPVIKRRIQERTDVVLRGEDLLPARPDTDDPIVHIDVDLIEGPEPGYAFAMWIVRGDTVSNRQRVECTLCTESEIVARVEVAVLEQVQSLEPEPATEPATEPDPTPEPPPAKVPPPEPTEPAEPAEPTEPTEPDGGRRPLGRAGKAGIGLMALGVAGAATGSVLVVLPPRVDPDDPLFETTTRPPGIGVLAGGVAVLVGGVVLLAIDRRRARRPVAGRLRPSRGGWALRF